MALAHLSEQGIHPPEEMPFRVPWTDRIVSPTFVSDFVGYHHGVLNEWDPANWMLNLGVWTAGEPVGTQSVRAKDFTTERQVETGSWLGKRFQGRGYGTEMRAAVLEFAFTGLEAKAAISGYMEGNVASARVSEKLGYRDAGETTVSPRGLPVRELVTRLDRVRWASRERPAVEIVGLEPCLPLFGVGS